MATKIITPTPKIVIPTPIKKEDSIITDYTVIKKINSGSFSSVYLIRNKKTKEDLAAKVILNSKEKKLKIYIEREINILFQIRHPTIIEYKGYSNKDFYGNDQKTILMKYLPKGPLSEIIKLYKLSLCPDDYKSTQQQIILIGIARGMMLLHKQNIIHRDLKLDNILLEDDYSPQIADFGLSKFYDPKNPMYQSQCNIGTLTYMAPEVIKGCEYNYQADVYSFGILMYEIINSNTAYHIDIEKKISGIDLGNKIIKGYRPEIPIIVKEKTRNLIEKCWSSNISERPTFSEIYQKLSTDKDYWLDYVDEDKILSYIEKVSVDIELITTNVPFKAEGSIPIKPPISPKPPKISPRSFITPARKNKDDYNLIYKHVCTDTIENLKKFLSEKISKSTNVNKFYIKMRKFIEFLTSNENYYFFNYDEEFNETNLIEEPEIYIEFLLVEKLIEKNCFVQTEFIEVLKEFNKVYIEIDFKSNYFDSIIGLVLKLKNIEKCKIAASVIFDTTKDINITLQKYYMIEIVNLNRINSPIHFISTFKECQLIKNLIFSNNCHLIDIGNDTFKNCKSLRNFSFFHKIKSIGDNAFKGCIFCEKVCCPTFISEIGNNAFQECFKLREIEFNHIKDIKSNAFEGCTSLITIKIDRIKNISSNAFKNCTSLKEININSIDNINSNAFEGCTSITKININFIISIESYAFKQCSSLKEINCKTISRIMSNAFDGCISLSTINVDSIGFIDLNVFKGFFSLKTIKCRSINEIMSSAFEECYSLTTIYVENIDLIDSKAFRNCFSLVDIKFNKINKIMSNAFEGCTSIKKFEVNICEIASSSFKCCKSIELFSIDDYKLNSIEESVFEGCSSLKNIKINKNNIFKQNPIKYIKKAAFKKCSSLKTIDAHFQVEIIEESAFEHCSKLLSFDFSMAKEIKSKCFFNCSSFEQISIPESITYIPIGAFYGCSSLQTLLIPTSVTIIDDEAFKNCTSLIQVMLPNTLKKIGNDAFNFCIELTFIAIPKSVKFIGENALYNCNKMKEITVSSSLKIHKIGLDKSVIIHKF